jgi:hypothetical protein
MIIDDIIRDEQNEIWAICGKKKVQLSAEYVATNKPQVGDELVQEEPKVEEAVAEEPKE